MEEGEILFTKVDIALLIETDFTNEFYICVSLGKLLPKRLY